MLAVMLSGTKKATTINNTVSRSKDHSMGREGGCKRHILLEKISKILLKVASAIACKFEDLHTDRQTCRLTSLSS